MNDGELLKRYTEEQADPAFAELVARHVDMVYATACRRVGDPHAAEDVCQAVFCLLLRKADGLLAMPDVGGWLHRTTCWKAAEYLRSERRRRFHEQAGAHENAYSQSPAAAHPAQPMDDAWSELAPLLDTTLDQLEASDRQLILLRFYRRLPLKEIGSLLEIREDAARMRVQRALERLRQKLVAVFPGVVGMATLAELLETRAAGPAPAGVASRILLKVPATVAQRGMVPSRAPLSVVRGRQVALAVAGLVAVTVTVGVLSRSATLSVRATPEALAATQVPAVPSGLPRGVGPRTAAAPSAAALESPEVTEGLEQLRRILYSTVLDTSDPPNDLRECLRELGRHPEPAFEVLAATLRDASATVIARRRAAWGFWLLTVQAPAIRERSEAELLAVVQSPESENLWTVSAFVLRTIGARAETVTGMAAALTANPPALATSLMFWESAARSVPAATATELRPWLEREGPYRFVAASALAWVDSERSVVLAAILIEGFEHPFGSSTAIQQAALSGLRKLGPLAAEQGPRLRQMLNKPELAQSVWLREQIFETLASIAPHLRSEIPEVEQLLHQREVESALQAAIEAPSAGVPELVAALASPGTSWRAALQLGELGPSAATALPALREALAGPDERARSYFADAIKAIDPGSPKPRYERDDLIAAVRGLADAWEQVRSGVPPTEAAWMEEFLKRTDVSAPTDLVAQSRRLQEIHPRLQEVWLAGLLKIDPALQEVLKGGGN